MATVYITEAGAQATLAYARLVVLLDDRQLLAVPLERVSHVVTVGRVGVTQPLLHELLRREIGLLLLDRWGRLVGRIEALAGRNLALRRRQYAATAESDFCLRTARSMVLGKVHNYRTMAMRIARSHLQAPRNAIARIESAIPQIETAPTLASLRGVEGAASRAYFSVLRAALPADINFRARVRRPPRDPVNSLLSLGYTMLAQACMAACEIVGLDPYDGIYHSDKYGRPALALDLMEEFRSVIVDSVVLGLVNRKMIGEGDFEPGPEGGLYLKPPAMRRFFRRYQARLQTTVQITDVGRPLTYQKILEMQARKLRRVIEGENDHYAPFQTR